MSFNNGHKDNWNLPEHRPAPDLWERIAEELDNPVSDYVDFQKALSTLPVHSPNPGLWNNLAETLNIEYPVENPVGFIKSAIPVVIFLLTGFFIYLTLSVSNNYLQVEQNNKTGNGILKQENDSEPDAKSNYAYKLKNNNDIKPEQQENKDNITGVKFNNNYKNNSKASTLDVDKNILSSNTLNNTISGIRKMQLQHPFSLQMITPRKIQKFEIPENEINPGLMVLKSNPDTNKYPNDNSRKRRFDIRNGYFGLYFMPENIYFKNGDMNVNRANNAGLNIGYKFDNVFLESGLELSFTQEKASYSIDYLQNELINSYTKVDSILYTIDPVTQKPVKHYVTSNVDVYDSIEYAGYAQTVNKYIYLRIPFQIGYKLVFRKMSLIFKGGTLLSVLVKGDEPLPTINGQQIKIVNIDRLSPDRLNYNWQIILSAGINIPVHKSLSVTFEPQYSYYLNSYYSQHKDYGKKPYSIGIRAGFLINF